MLIWKTNNSSHHQANLPISSFIVMKLWRSLWSERMLTGVSTPSK